MLFPIVWHGNRLEPYVILIIEVDSHGKFVLAPGPQALARMGDLYVHNKETIYL